METSKMETTDIRQVEALLHERTQSLPILQRIKLYDCAYIVFCYLHLKGQLKRHKAQFDEACVNDLNQMFKRLYDRL